MKKKNNIPEKEEQELETVVESTEENSDKISNSEDNSNDTDNEIITNAYVDRIEKVENGVDKAVLYFGDDDEPEKVVMPMSMLPKGVKADDSLIIKILFEAVEL